MQTQLSRRKFLWRTSMAAGASICFGKIGDLIGSESIRMRLDAADRTCLNFLSRFGANPTFYGGTVAARQAGLSPALTHALVEIVDFRSLAEALGSPKKHGIGKIHSSNDRITFQAGARNFEVELLTSEGFAARRSALDSGDGLAFAHEALQFDPTTNRISDPFNAEMALRPLRKSENPPEAIADLTEGLIQADCFNLTRSAQFDSWQVSVFQLDPQGSDAQVTRAFLGNLSALSEAVPAPEMEKLLHSHLLSNAFRTHLGIDTTSATVLFTELRSRTDGSFPDGALWMSVLLESEIRKDIVDPLISSYHSARQTANRRALQSARLLLT